MSAKSVCYMIVGFWGGHLYRYRVQNMLSRKTSRYRYHQRLRGTHSSLESFYIESRSTLNPKINQQPGPAFHRKLFKLAKKG